ncbi:peptidase C14, caspase domain-containing protein [Armillaria novae-zelandiae]|uniref:Peptidase C14, caspase domain-containing protein n=1 Tax=Armillaria novae-zelandiae TaxID=153914 RepID=A0AA39UJF5_9AGAR|nr:peptidase C14, caspase domain-containing protein [Armillaria novae-zelandiae]
METDDIVQQLKRLGELRRHLPAPHPQPTPTPAIQHRVDALRFWAVLIGIDAYGGNPLHGCVSDAKLMKKSLIEDVGVPEERIKCLLGSQIPSPSGDPFTPSRSNIVNMLYSLKDNPDIDSGDNIIIYYAGHGSSYYCSDHLFTESICRTSGCPVEALCPIDRDTIDSDGHWVPDISDRELSTLLTMISHAKGSHITVITDCCHATSFERQLDRGMAVRTTRPTFHSDVKDMLRTADERLKDLPHYRSVLSKDWEADMSSYIVLAACRDYQSARETLGKEGYSGIFTKTLVEVLKSGAWKNEVTYVGLTELLNQSYSQTPVVAGDHIYERIWYQGIEC